MKKYAPAPTFPTISWILFSGRRGRRPLRFTVYYRHTVAGEGFPSRKSFTQTQKDGSAMRSRFFIVPDSQRELSASGLLIFDYNLLRCFNPFYLCTNCFCDITNRYISTAVHNHWCRIKAANNFINHHTQHLAADC